MQIPAEASMPLVYQLRPTPLPLPLAFHPSFKVLPFADFIQAAIAKLRPGYRGELEHQTAAKMTWRPKPLAEKIGCASMEA